MARRPTQPVLAGMSLCLLTIGGYLFGSNRNFTHDGGTTVGALIADRPLSDALSRSVSYNNHPLASLVGQLVWRLGGTSELALRFAGVAAAGVTVGVIAWWASERWNPRVGLAAAILVASNPLIATSARSVRGYSFMVMGIVLSTILLVEQVERRGMDPDDQRTLAGISYSVLVGIAIAGHAYGGIAVVVHVAYLLGKGSIPGHWRFRLVAGLALGFLAYLPLIPLFFSGGDRQFTPGLPLGAAVDIASGQWWLAPVLWVSAIVVAKRASSRDVLLPGAVVLGCLSVLWLVVQPQDIYPRMLQFLVPPFCIAVAIGFDRLGRAAMPLSMAVATASLLPQAAAWSTDPMANEEAALVADNVDAAGGSTCLAGWTSYSVWAYTRTPVESRSLDELVDCDLVIAVHFEDQQEAFNRLEAGMDHHQAIDATAGWQILLYWADEMDTTVRSSVDLS